MEEKIKILILEDLPSDAELAEREIKAVLNNYKIVVADTEQGFIKALENFKPDLIISDYKLPAFNGMKALQITRKKKEFIPFIILTGSMNEETAVECMKAGADDYVIKEHIKRLGPSIINALDKKKIRQERKQAEEALRESEMKFRNLSESTRMGIGLYQNDYWIYANPAAEEISGYTFDELKHMKFWEFIAPEYVDLIKENGRARQKGKLAPSGYEFKIITKQGKEKWVLLTGNTTELKSGKAGLISVIDITERKQAEKALKTSLQQIEMINANTPNIIWKSDIDKQGNFSNTYISEVVDEFLTLPKGTINNSWNKYFSYIIPDYLPQINELFKKAIANPGQLFSFSYEVKKADGKKAWFTSSGRIRVENNKLTAYGSTADITERKQAEQALRLNRERLNHLFTVNPAMVYELDPENFSPTWVSPNVTEVTGYTPEEALQPGWWAAHVHPEDREETKKAQERLKDEDQVAHEYRFQKKDGRYIWVRDELRLLRDEQGTAKEIVGSWMNITERKEAEIELAKSEQRYRSIFENTGTTMIILNEDGAIAFANGQCTAATGYSPEELQGTDWRGYVFADDLPMMENYFRLRFSDPEKAPNRYETRLIHADGSTKNCMLTTDTIPTTRQIVVSMLDITDRMQAEEELRVLETAIDNSIECIMVSDRENRLTYVNRAFEKLTGYSAAEALGNTPGMLKSGQHNRAFYQNLKKTIYEGHPWQGNLTLKKKNDDLYVVYASITPILDQAGIPKHFVSVHRDVTRERELEQRIQQNQRLEAIGTLAGGIAHDFNNLLAPIVGYTELCMAALPSGSKVKEDLEEVMRAARRATDLVGQILSFSRRSAHERRPLQMAPIIKEALKLLRASIPVTIDIRQETTDTAESVVADPTEIHQVVMNLCTNAFHAMPDGGILTVTLKAVDLDRDASALLLNCAPGRYLNLTVADTGQGIAPDIRDRIFEPYFTTKEAGRGTGLGLAVTHSIVAACGGSINVYSEPGKGTRFSLYFPVVEDTSIEEVEKATNIVSGHESILFIDDEAALVELGKKTLERYGYSVTISMDPVQALELFKKAPADWDMVISDMTMPGMTGDLLAEAMLKIRPDLLVILCTGFSDRMNKEKAQKMGIRRLLDKPVSPVTLVATIREIFDRKES